MVLHVIKQVLRWPQHHDARIEPLGVAQNGTKAWASEELIKMAHSHSISVQEDDCKEHMLADALADSDLQTWYVNDVLTLD
jgi:type III secretion system FlhB-like substrate exporter